MEGSNTSSIKKKSLLVKKNVLVMAAGESSLIGLNPASGVVLLHKVPAGLGQTVLQSGDQGKQATLQVDIQTVLTICLETKVTLWNGIPLIAPFTPALQTQVGTSTPDSWILPPVLLNNILTGF